jgi:hypothetical protein
VRRAGTEKIEREIEKLKSRLKPGNGAHRGNPEDSGPK